MLLDYTVQSSAARPVSTTANALASTSAVVHAHTLVCSANTVRRKVYHGDNIIIFSDMPTRYNISLIYVFFFCVFFTLFCCFCLHVAFYSSVGRWRVSSLILAPCLDLQAIIVDLVFVLPLNSHNFKFYDKVRFSVWQKENAFCNKTTSVYSRFFLSFC